MLLIKFKSLFELQICQDTRDGVSRGRVLIGLFVVFWFFIRFGEDWIYHRVQMRNCFTRAAIK